MIQRSESAQYAKALFYATFNDIDVFVEDTAAESKKIYVEILKRVFNNKISIGQVFPLGPKPTVLKRCGEDQGERSRPAVYIVDGDYDLLLGVELPRLKRLYRLNRYCIENYLIDPEAIVDIAIDESTSLDEGPVRQKLDYDGWEHMVSTPLKKIAISLAVSHKKQCGLPSVRVDMARIQGAHLDHVDAAKVEAFVSDYEQKVDEKFGVGEFKKLSDEIGDQTTVGEFFRVYASGKSLLMPLILCRIKRRLGMAVDYRKLRVKLARRCAVEDLVDISGYVQ